MQQTTQTSLSANIDSNETITYAAPTTGAPVATPGTPTYTTQLSVVDSLGTTQTLNLNMTKNYPDAWTAQVTGAWCELSISSVGILFNPEGGIQAEGAVTSRYARSNHAGNLGHGWNHLSARRSLEIS